MKKTKIRKQLFIFAVVLCLSVGTAMAAYAFGVLSGGVSEEGSAISAMNTVMPMNASLMNLRFFDVSATASGQPDSSVEFELLPCAEGRAAQTVSLEMNFREPGDSATVSFRVMNAGTLNARIERLMVRNNTLHWAPYEDLPDWITLSGDFRNLSGLAFHGFIITEIFTLTFTVTDGAAWQNYKDYLAQNNLASDAEGYSFSIEFDYVLA
ncbi:MAG: hypothetical protein FWD19_03695 [Defluviitaleaceae bacterium]|nr:hypothetical protein [Defluviitaleaceae bacterium]